VDDGRSGGSKSNAFHEKLITGAILTEIWMAIVTCGSTGSYQWADSPINDKFCQLTGKSKALQPFYQDMDGW